MRPLDRQGTEEHRVHQAEDRRVRADAEREREQGDGGEDGIGGEPPQAVARVLQQHLDPRQPALLAVALRRRCDSAELDERLTPRLLRLEPGAHAVLHVHLQVALQLLGQLAVARAASERSRQPHEPAPDLSRAHQDSCGGARKRARIAVASSHLRASRSICLRPARVNL